MHNQEASVGQALVDVFHAGQQVAVDRIDLIRVDLKETLAHGIRAGVVSLTSILLIIFSGAALIAAGVIFLDEWLPLEASLAAIGAAVGLTGLIMARASQRMAKRGS